MFQVGVPAPLHICMGEGGGCVYPMTLMMISEMRSEEVNQSLQMKIDIKLLFFNYQGSAEINLRSRVVQFISKLGSVQPH